MKGIIMAGGEGTRLRPLTCDCPKPMIRLMDRPLMQYALELLRRHGITRIAATLGYLPDAIPDRFGDGGDFGVELRYFTEHTPLGTAGGVRRARSFLDETFVVLSGDGVTDLDITRAASFHRAKGALATLVLKHADNPMDYGVVDVDADGRVRSFHEKPDWSDVLSDAVNTGIYILEPAVLDRIPADRPCDFGHELFPRLVAEGLPVYGYVTGDYWCDVGDVRAYLGVHADAMEGRIRLDGLAPLRGRAVQLPGSLVDRAAVLEGPCLIDAGAQVCAGAYVGPYSVIGAGSVVGERASVKRGILWPGARLEPRAQARGCVLASGAALGADAQAYEESVLGTRAAVGERGVLMPGVKLWPGKRGAEGERLDANRVWGGRRDPGFEAGALPVASPAEAVRAAQACVASMKPREVVLGYADAGPSPAGPMAGTGAPSAETDAAAETDPPAETDPLPKVGPLPEALWHAAAAGCMAQGARVIDAGRCSLPVLRRAQRACGADAALFLCGGAITPLNALGAPLPGKARRSVAALYARQDFPPPAPAEAGPVLRTDCAELSYIADIAGRFRADASGAAPLLLACAEEWTRSLAERALRRAGLRVRAVPSPGDARPGPGELALMLEDGGARCTLADGDGALTDAQGQLLAAWAALEGGCRALLLPASATRGVEALARRYGAETQIVAGEPAAWMNALAERAPQQFGLYSDGLLLAVTALSILTEKRLSLAEWRRAMPEVHRRSRSIPMPSRQNGRVLHAFAEARPGAQLGGGVRFEREGGWAWVGADERHPRLRIVAEGASAEFADELCDFCEAELRRLGSESGAEGRA